MEKSVSKKRSSTQKLTVTALLSAIIIVMTFTPLGYLNIGFVEITFMTIPVAIGAIVCGPAAGTFLGGVFGLTSYLTCFGILRPSPFGQAICAISPIATGIVCLVPRILAGLIAGLIFKAFKNKVHNIAYAVTSLSMGILNTAFFVSFLIIFFGKDNLSGIGLGDNVLAIILSLVTINAVIEWVACLIAGFSVSNAMTGLLKRMNAK